MMAWRRNLAASSRRLIAFLLLAFGVSWVGGIAWVMAVSPWISSGGYFAAAYVPTVVVVLGPAIAAILVTRVADGADAAARLLGRLAPRRAHWKWYLGIPAFGIIAAGLAYLAAGVPAHTLVESAAGRNTGRLVAHFALQILLVGVGEEVGWRGWLLPHLARKRGVAIATVLTILTWELWHLPKLMSGPASANLAVLLAAMGIILSWLWVRLDGDVFALAVTHGSANAPIFLIEQVAALDASRLLSGLRNLVFVYGVAAVIVAVRWWQLRRSPS
jgi:CAAX protease family protein